VPSSDSQTSREKGFRNYTSPKLKRHKPNSKQRRSKSGKRRRRKRKPKPRLKLRKLEMLRARRLPLLKKELRMQVPSLIQVPNLRFQ
jgi:hypothetical protein